MKMNLKMLLVVVAVCICTACQKGFSGMEVVTNDFESRRAMFESGDYFSVFDRQLTTPQRQALQFLYAYMPLPDITDYSGDFYLMNVDYALKARAEMPWGSRVPDREFIHFVRPVRVNNENMDESRRVFYEELKERVLGLSMYDAVLEVNHWCHEKVTYTPSDVRTSSPLASVRTAYGRCGEESTFTVAALRAVGIPARQVYTPRWAHTDNNHAWVEAWVDGKWHFLGACEPEAVLDLGWFNAPASRGMLMHTKVFGKYNGPEEVVGRNACYTEINVTEGYAPVAPVVVRVVDEQGNPVEATVEFKIYNYAEFYTAAVKQSDKEGYASLTTGCGDLLVWASKEGKYGYAKCSVNEKSDTTTIVLDKLPGYTATFELNIVPPKERNTIPQLTEEQIATNTARFAYEDSIRNAYVATFITAEQAKALAASLQMPEEEVVTVLNQSRGNYETITSFLKDTKEGGRARALRLLQVVAAKDRRDISRDVLDDHLSYTSLEQEGKAYFDPYILNPRISNEMLTPYKAFFREAISADSATVYRNNPENWVAWCRNHIKVNGDWNPQQLCMAPSSVWKLRCADTHSRNIFFVAAARSMGIPSRIDEVTGKTQYLNEQNKWVDVKWNESVETEKVSPQGTLYASYTPSKFLDDPKYYSHFTLSKIVDGRLQLLNYAEEATTWKSLLKNGASLDSGDYLLVSGTRMADGSVLAQLTFLNVPANEKVQAQLVQRESKDGLQVIGDFNSENIFYDLSTQQKRSILSATGRGFYIIALIAPNSEPTNHFLRDVMPYKEEFEKWGQKMVLLFKDESEASRFQQADFANLPKTIVFGTDIDDTIHDEIVNNMKLTNTTRPVILVADTFNRVVFLSQGYSIGLGEQLVKVIHQLEEK
ncbi:MAG: transglutaminase domain-containing protein [Bacteroides sp.]|nr:transglutaminase domain-containing protein [Bacteroides sp.]